MISGDYQTPSLGKLTAKQLQALQKYGPQTARTLQQVSAELAPKDQALQLQLLQQFGPQFSQIGSDIAKQEALANVQRDLAITQGPGQDLVQQALALDRAANPEFYSQREATNKGFLDLIGGQDPNKLTGAELANVERGVNRSKAGSGNLNTGDATSTVAGAMTFGNELNAKRDRFAQALSLFPGISAASRTNIDPFQIATGRSSQTPNFGQQQFQLQNGQNYSGDLTGNIANSQQLQQNVNAGRRTVSDFVNQSYNSAVGSSCCFIMIAASESFELPWWIRTCRDYYYFKEPRVKRGYKRMARKIVPIMEQNLLIRKLIKYSMYYPLSFYGAWTQGLNKFGWMMKPIKNFWFAIWRNY